MSTVLLIDSNPVNLDEEVQLNYCTFYKRGSYPVLNFQRRGVDLPDTDPYLGKSCVLSIDGVVRFRGRVTASPPTWTGIGWVVAYQALGQRFIGDLYPFIQESDGMSSATFNLTAEDQDFNPGRSGRNAGQILTTVLNWDTNLANLGLAGIIITDDTQSDLDSIVHVPPKPVTIGGDKLLSAIESFLDSEAPNYALYIEPSNGALRFINMRDVDAINLIMGDYLGSPPNFGIDVSDCRQAILVKGQPWTIPMMISLADGSLVEDFGFTLNGITYTNTDAKNLWTPDIFQNPNNLDSLAASIGTCSASSTTTFTIDPSDNTQFWDANYWDQTDTGRKGWVFLYAPSASGINQYISRRIVSNTQLTAGGTCSITLDLPIDSTIMSTYSQFKIYGMAGGLLNCWRKYKITNQDIVDHLADRFLAPVPWISSVTTAASLTIVKCGVLIKNGQEIPVTFTIDRLDGHVYFDIPTCLIFRPPGGIMPVDDIRLMLPVFTSENTVRVPASGFEGTSYSQYGLTDPMVVFLSDWRDPLNKDQVTIWAQSLLDSIKDVQVSGSVDVFSKLTDAFSMGRGVNLVSASYTTGYESANIPIVSCTLNWVQGNAYIFQTTIEFSNRNNPYGAEDFMTPQRPWAVPLEGEVFDASKQDPNVKTYTAEDTIKQINDRFNKENGIDPPDSKKPKKSKDREDQ